MRRSPVEGLNPREGGGSDGKRKSESLLESVKRLEVRKPFLPSLLGTFDGGVGRAPRVLFNLALAFSRRSSRSAISSWSVCDCEESAASLLIEEAWSTDL